MIGYGTAWNMAHRFMAHNQDEGIRPQIDKCTEEN